MKAIIIVIYMGALPNYFNLFLSSVRKNPEFDWLMVTDNKIDNAPPNMKVLNYTFSQLKTKFQQPFDFEIKLERPYKLCDFKPAFGDVFYEEIKDYDFYAYGDIDLIYGRLCEFVSEGLFNAYDRVFTFGHLSFFRNTEEIRKSYRQKVEGCIYYKDAFSTEKSLTFDEWGKQGAYGYYHIFQSQGFKTYNKIVCADISYIHNAMRCHFGGDTEAVKKELHRRKVRYVYEDGNLYRLHGRKKERKSVMYIHLQKRKMKNSCTNENRFYIYPYEFRDKESIRPFCFGVGYSKYYIKHMFRKIFKRK